jgi:hypothetical protein
MNKNMITTTPSHPQFVAAKAAWVAARVNQGVTDQQKKAACNEYRAAMWRCLRESGLGR